MSDNDSEPEENDDKKDTLTSLVNNYHKNEVLNDKFAELFPNLNTRASRISQFKRMVIASQPNILNLEFDKERKDYKEYKAFTAASQPEQYRVWLQAKKSKEPTKWQTYIAHFNILPKSLSDLKLPATEVKTRMKALAKRQNELDRKVQEVNGNKMINALSALESNQIWDVCAALILATGRRSTELMSKGRFEVIGEYEMEMMGQLKSGLYEHDGVKFPTLAPAAFILSKINQFRVAKPMGQLTNAEINAKYAKQLGNTTERLFSLNPHALRAVYAIMASQKYNTNTSVPRFIADILGHSDRSNAAYYQRIKLVNYDGQIYAPTTTPAETKQEIKTAPTPDTKADVKDEKKIELLSAVTKTDTKYNSAIMKLLHDNKKITQSAIKTEVGGDIATIKKFIEKNSAFVMHHNKTLA